MGRTSVVADSGHRAHRGDAAEQTNRMDVFAVHDQLICDCHRATCWRKSKSAAWIYSFRPSATTGHASFAPSDRPRSPYSRQRHVPGQTAERRLLPLQPVHRTGDKRQTRVNLAIPFTRRMNGRGTRKPLGQPLPQDPAPVLHGMWMAPGRKGIARFTFQRRCKYLSLPAASSR